jgi:3-oxoacyl-[acyl-carrier protein] reductase
MELRGASALVTGAGRGIGRAIARTLAQEGVALTVLARTASDLESLVREIQATGGRAVAHPGDVTDPAVCAAAVAHAREANGRLQILVNNAGIGEHVPVAQTTDAQWDRMLATNLSAPFRLTRAALPQLTQGGGHVFMISSLAGSNAIEGMAAYCATKAGLDHFARCLMLEVRHQGVKVTTIAPGSVDTSFGGSASREASWMLRAEDIAAAVLDLLHARDEAHLSRVEMRPLRPARRT